MGKSRTDKKKQSPEPVELSTASERQMQNEKLAWKGRELENRKRL